MSHAFEGFEMHPGNNRSILSPVVIQALGQYGKLSIGTIDHVNPVSVEEEEAGLSALDPTIGSATLVKPREQVIGAFQALVRDAFRRHNIPEQGGLDVGSGASGYMVAKLLPPEAQANWLQMELSPAAAEMNRNANPGKHVITGSYLRLEEQGAANMFNVVTGLSSLDATGHIDRAVEQIRKALNVGGYLMHMQDTRPGITIAHEQLRRQNAVPPYTIIYTNDPGARPNNGLIYGQGATGLDVLELFRRRLGRALADNGSFDVLENRWMTAIGRGTTPGMNKHSELGVMVGLESEDESFDTASGVITVARRVR